MDKHVETYISGFAFNPNPVEINADVKATLIISSNEIIISALHNTNLISNAKITLTPEGELVISINGAGGVLGNAKIALEAL